MDVRFTPTRFRAGYDMAEVDVFLDRCEQALKTGDGSVNAESVLDMRFTPTRFREAYEMAEVDAFLDDVLAPRFVALAADGAAAQDVPAQDAMPAGNPALRDPAQSGLAQSVPAQSAPAQSGPARGAGHPVPHPAEKRGFLARLLRGR